MDWSHLNLAPMSASVAKELYGAGSVKLDEVIARRAPVPVVKAFDKKVSVGEAKKMAKDAQIASANLFDVLPGMSVTNTITHKAGAKVMKQSGALTLPNM